MEESGNTHAAGRQAADERDSSLWLRALRDGLF